MAIIDIKKLIEEGGVIFMAFVGFMSQNLLNTMIESLEEDKKLGNIPTKHNHSIFIILIEMTQNIIKYANNENIDKGAINSDGMVLVGKKKDDTFYVHSQNVIALKDIENIDKRLKEIKKLSEEEITKHYKKLRRSGINSHAAGAGIGFYEIAKRADNIFYEFEEISPNKYNFYLTVQLKKGE